MTLENRIVQTTNLLRDIEYRYSPAVFANSLGAEDMVLTHLIASARLKIDMFMLDTGRLHDETYRLLQEIRGRYHLTVRVYAPDTRDVERFETELGPNAMYTSVELRKHCCDIRKVFPLRRALNGKQAWITGLRREQSVTRRNLAESEWDEGHQLQKFNPLLEWSQDDVWNFIKNFAVPYNALHDQGFPSIGCAPCTRAVKPGEDVRAGRWWWETPATKECGLHAAKS